MMTAQENEIITRLARLEQESTSSRNQREKLFDQNREQTSLLHRIEGKIDGQAEKVAELRTGQKDHDERIGRVETHVDRMKFLGIIAKTVAAVAGLSGIGAAISWLTKQGSAGPISGGD